MAKNKSKCDFCNFWTGQSCMVTPNSSYCSKALQEYQYYLNCLKANKTPVQTKSLRPWDKR